MGGMRRGWRLRHPPHGAVRARKVFLEGSPGCSPLLECLRRDRSPTASPSLCLEGDWLWRLSILSRGDALRLLNLKRELALKKGLVPATAYGA